MIIIGWKVNACEFKPADYYGAIKCYQLEGFEAIGRSVIIKTSECSVHGFIVQISQCKHRA